MGTYAVFCAEIRKAGIWELNQEDVFPFHKLSWQRQDGDVREFWEFPFPAQSYALFGFLADVRNSNETAVLKQPCDLPEDASAEAVELLAPNIGPDDIFGVYGGVPSKLETVADRVHAGRGESYDYSWLSLAEMLAFDYDLPVIDKRESAPIVTTYREYLGEGYFEQLEALKRLGAPEDVRILFCFNG